MALVVGHPGAPPTGGRTDVSPDAALAVALRRLLGTTACPEYVRAAALPWLAARATNQ